MRTLLGQIFFFIFVGCSATFAHWATAVAVVEILRTPPLLANFIGWLVAFVVSFSGHYHFTFRHLSRSWRVAARRFFLVSAAGFLINEASYAWLLQATHLPYDLLLAIILLGLAVITFLASRWWAFRHKHVA